MLDSVLLNTRIFLYEVFAWAIVINGSTVLFFIANTTSLAVFAISIDGIDHDFAYF